MKKEEIIEQVMESNDFEIIPLKDSLIEDCARYHIRWGSMYVDVHVSTVDMHRSRHDLRRAAVRQGIHKLWEDRYGWLDTMEW